MPISTYSRPNIHQNGPEILGVKRNLAFVNHETLGFHLGCKCVVRGEMPLEPIASWFFPKCIEAQ
jgi:hypothetical protein